MATSRNRRRRSRRPAGADTDGVMFIEAYKGATSRMPRLRHIDSARSTSGLAKRKASGQSYNLRVHLKPYANVVATVKWLLGGDVTAVEEGSPFWVGEEVAAELAHYGSAVMHAAHEARPRIGGWQNVKLQFLPTDSFEAFTVIKESVPTICISRGWTVYAGQSLLSATLHDRWPAAISASENPREERHSRRDPKEAKAYSAFLIGQALLPLAYRFVYLHEFFHAALGHTDFLSRHFGGNAFATNLKTNASMSEVREIRSAFELEADLCAFKTLLTSALRGDLNATLGSQSTSVLGLSTVVELLYLMTLEMTNSMSLLQPAAVMRFDDPGVYCSPVKRRFYLIAKLYESCADGNTAEALEHSLDYGSGVARACYSLNAPSRAGPPNHENFLSDFTHLFRSGRIMRDPTEWVRHNDAVLRRVRAQLSPNTRPLPYDIRFIQTYADQVGKR